MPRCGCGHRLPSEDFETDDEDSDEGHMPSWIKFWEQEDRKIVSTRASKLVEKKLRTCNRVIILGEAGCGKSAIALNIALKYGSQKWKVVMVKDLKDIESAPVEHKSVIFVINDPVGKTALDEISCRLWYLQKHLLSHYFSTDRQAKRKAKTPKVIVTCRSNLTDEDINHHFKEFTLINMDEENIKLTKEEKEIILKKHIDCSRFTDADIKELLKTEKSFPLLSELVSASKSFEGNIHAFYREPFVEIKKEIASLKDISTEKYMCLFLLNLCGNRLREENFEDKEDDYNHMEGHDDGKNGVGNNDGGSEKGNNAKDREKSNEYDEGTMDSDENDSENEENDSENEDDYDNNDNDNKELDKQMMNDLLKAFNLPENISKRVLFENLNHFRGHYFVKRVKNIFQITNDSFLLALTHIFCSSFPEQFLKYCPSTFFRTVTTSSNAQSGIIPYVQLQDNYINSFVDRIQADIKACTFLNVFMSPWIRDESVLSSLQMRFEAMSYDEMLQMTLNFKLDVDLKIAKLGVRKQLAGFSRLDLVGLSKEVSPIILSLVLNLDDLFHAMFTLIKKNARGSKHLKSAHLMSACCVNGREDLAKLILDIADERQICWSRQENIYPMHIAANFLNTDILKLVLDSEHDVNMTTRAMESPFYLAAAAGRYGLQNIQWTCKRGVSNSSNKYEELIEEYRLKTLILLRQRGAEVNTHPDALPSALAYSCQRGYIDTVQFMIKNAANTNDTNDKKFGALHFASEVGKIEIVQLLLQSGADISVSTAKGLTPLYLASLNGHADVVAMFLSKGTKEELKKKSGNNPFFVACRHGHKSIVQMFLEYDPFVNCKLPDNTTALLTAVDNGHKEIVGLLLKNGADANIVRKKSKISPLYSAADSGYDGILELLLKCSASVDMETVNGNIPLDIASQNGHHSIVQTLLENGANVNHYNLERKSPLFYAAENGHYEILMLLLQKKAELNV